MRMVPERGPKGKKYMKMKKTQRVSNCVLFGSGVGR
jgi:hypothetical protein